MARAGHFGDCSGKWARISKLLFAQLGMQVPYEALTAIRQIRGRRKGPGGAGNTENKLEVKILLCVRDGIPWSEAYVRHIEYIVPPSKGGHDVLTNIKLSA